MKNEELWFLAMTKEEQEEDLTIRRILEEEDN